jgi:hypothetical protein
MILVELNSDRQLFKLLEVSKFCVDVEPMGAHTEGKEHRLLVCGKRVLRGISVSNREDVKGDGSKLPNG